MCAPRQHDDALRVHVQLGPALGVVADPAQGEQDVARLLLAAHERVRAVVEHARRVAAPLQLAPVQAIERLFAQAQRAPVHEQDRAAAQLWAGENLHAVPRRADSSSSLWSSRCCCFCRRRCCRRCRCRRRALVSHRCAVAGRSHWVGGRDRVSKLYADRAPAVCCAPRFLWSMTAVATAASTSTAPAEPAAAAAADVVAAAAADRSSSRRSTGRDFLLGYCGLCSPVLRTVA
jgi:hypothetical protein